MKKEKIRYTDGLTVKYVKSKPLFLLMASQENTQNFKTLLSYTVAQFSLTAA